MVTVIVVNIVAVMLAYLARYRQTKQGLKASFFLLFLFLALRFEYGNDYSNYLQSFIDINQDPFITIFGSDSYFEPGWILLCRLFSPFGFFAMTAVLALLNCIIYYRFIEKYVPVRYYWFAVFLYVFGPGLMLVHLSAMRQSISIGLFLIAIDFIVKKDVIRYSLCIALASLFHLSAIILLPVYFLGLLNWKIDKITAAGIVGTLIALFLLGSLFVAELNQFIESYFPRYAIYQASGTIGSGLGLLFNLFLFALILYYDRYQSRDVALLFKISILGYFVIPLALLLSAIGRIGMYFQPATLAVFPLLIWNIKNVHLGRGILALIVFITIYQFYGFFRSDVYMEAYSTYNTIFSSPEIY